MDLKTLQTKSTTTAAELCVAFELGGGKWRLALSDGRRTRQVSVGAGDLVAVMSEVTKTKEKMGLDGARVVSCYEAGRDGFWLHRELVKLGIESMVVDSASIEVNRHARRAKTDRLDAQRLVQQLRRYVGGETQALHVVAVPSVAQEDDRRLVRQRDVLMKEKKQHESRIDSLLALFGLEAPKGRKSNWEKAIEEMKPRGVEGGEWPPHVKSELLREVGRLKQVLADLAVLEKEREERLKQPPDKLTQAMTLMMSLCGVGGETAWVLGTEFFGWREFENRRQVGAAAGLTPTPHKSSGISYELGISKAGNARVRTLLVEIAWCWLKYQPESALSKWFYERFAKGSRTRRIGIVALARRLVVLLWRLVNDGEVPQDVMLKKAA